jgi:hypothetical protein
MVMGDSSLSRKHEYVDNNQLSLGKRNFLFDKSMNLNHYCSNMRIYVIFPVEVSVVEASCYLAISRWQEEWRLDPTLYLSSSHLQYILDKCTDPDRL